jgi:hypothetical protein
MRLIREPAGILLVATTDDQIVGSVIGGGMDGGATSTAWQ